MVDVFISYSRANRDMVCRLAEAIGRLGYVVWWDEELPAHLSYGEVITAKIAEAKATLVVWSAESAASEWVRAEADMARNQKKLIQTSIDDCPPPLPFNQIQYAAIGDWTGAEDHPGWRKARASLAALCGPAPTEADAPVPPPVAAPVAAPVAKRPPAVFYEPPQRPGKPRSRANRLAAVTIAASLAIILTVGGLMLLRGSPSAQAQAAPPPAAAAPVQAQPAAVTPPKTVTVDLPVETAEEGAEGGEAEPAEEAPDTGGDD